MQIPVRPVEINIRAINLDHLLLQLSSEGGMSIQAFTIGYAQWQAVVAAVRPWVDLERPQEPEDNPIPRIVSPTGKELIR